MPIPVTITFTAPDPDVAPATFGDAVDQLNALVGGTVPDPVSYFIKSYETPGVDDQDKLWFRINTLGNLVGTYIFTQGVWAPSEPPVSARFGIFTGDPTEWFDGNGVGLKGSGPIAMDYWGWTLMNGNNGGQNWSNRFLIGGAMDNDGITGFNNGWLTNVNGAAESVGGVAEITLDADSTYNPGLVVGRHTATDEDADAGGNLYGTGTTGALTLITANTEPAPVSVVNPFIAVAYIGFTGYI